MVNLSWKACMRLVVSIFLLYLMVHYWGVFAGAATMLLGAAGSLIFGALIAYAVNIPMSFYESYLLPKSKSSNFRIIRRAFCLLLAYFSVFAIVLLIVRLIVPELYSCIQVLIQEAPPYIERLLTYMNQNFDLYSVFGSSSTLLQPPNGEIDWQDVVSRGINFLISGLGGVMSSIFTVLSTVFSFALTLILGIIFSIYLLMGKDRLHLQIQRIMRAYLKPIWNNRLMYVFQVVDNCFHRFIVGQCTEAVILGGLCMWGMTLLKFPYATMIGALIGFTALIPIAGAYIGASVGAFMIFTVSPVKALLFLLFITLLQQFEGNVIYPKVVGSSIGLPGIWVLAAITIGGGIAGVGGMLIGVPLAASIYQLLGADVRRRELLSAPPPTSPPAPEPPPTNEHEVESSQQ